MNWSDDGGQVAGIETIPFGILLFVIGALLVANAWAVIDVKMAVTSAAREAARTYVEAPDHVTGVADAQRAARDAQRDRRPVPQRRAGRSGVRWLNASAARCCC